jgi:hypothetical protein
MYNKILTEFYFTDVLIEMHFTVNQTITYCVDFNNMTKILSKNSKTIIRHKETL